MDIANSAVLRDLYFKKKNIFKAIYVVIYVISDRILIQIMT